MDNTKTGLLIKELRKEKAMTQKDIADILHITDKAVSKWERGLCAPDISLLEPLSKILDISIVELIEGKRIIANEHIAEIEKSTKTVINYSKNEIAYKTKQVKKKYIKYIIIAVALAIALGLIGARFYLHEHFKQYYEWADEARSTGPWADQAIWISEDKDIYLICVQEQPDEFANISAFVYWEGSWVSCDLNWISGTKTLELSEKETGSLFLTGAFSVEAESFNISELSEPAAHNFLQGRSSISLSKYSYDQQITRLPFDFESIAQ